MTNASIIHEQSLALMAAGLLKGTGKFLRVLTVDEDGNESEEMQEIPEPIHTFAAWKELGYCVKKGEHSQIKFAIWKYVNSKKSEAMDDGVELAGDNGHCIMKLAHFFTAAQVEKVEGLA